MTNSTSPVLDWATVLLKSVETRWLRTGGGCIARDAGGNDAVVILRQDAVTGEIKEANILTSALPAKSAHRLVQPAGIRENLRRAKADLVCRRRECIADEPQILSYGGERSKTVAVHLDADQKGFAVPHRVVFSNIRTSPDFAIWLRLVRSALLGTDPDSLIEKHHYRIASAISQPASARLSRGGSG